MGVNARQTHPTTLKWSAVCLQPCLRIDIQLCMDRPCKSRFNDCLHQPQEKSQTVQLGDGRNSWQWAKHVWLQSGLLQALKVEHVSSGLSTEGKLNFCVINTPCGCLRTDMQILILTGELHEGFQHRRYGCRFVVIGNKGLPRRGDLWQRYMWLRKNADLLHKNVLWVEQRKHLHHVLQPHS